MTSAWPILEAKLRRHTATTGPPSTGSGMTQRFRPTNCFIASAPSDASAWAKRDYHRGSCARPNIPNINGHEASKVLGEEIKREGKTLLGGSEM